MSFINAILRPVFDGLLSPFRSHPWIGLVVVSLLTAVGMLLIWKRTSDQKAIAAVKRRIHACIFEIRLFNDDLVAILRAQGEILRHNLTYLRLSLVPMLFTLPPLVLAIAQLQFHYGYEGFVPEQAVLLEVGLEQGPAGGNGLSLEDIAKPSVELLAPEGIRVDTPPLWIPSARQVDWRLVPERPGEYELVLRMDGESFTKTLLVSSEVLRRSPSRLRAGFVNQLLYPAEPSLPANGPIESITVSYPERGFPLFGWELHWMVVYFVLAIVFAFLLRRPFGVEL